MEVILSFKNFLKEEEQAGHIKSLADELGIEPDMLKNQPQVASFFSLGNDLYNLGAYKIIDFKRDDDGNPTHAVVKLINNLKGTTRRRYKSAGEEKVRVPDIADDKTFVVPIDQLQGLMTQSLQSAGGAAGGPGGGMGGPPGGGMAI